MTPPKPLAIVSANVPDDLLAKLEENLELHVVPAGTRLHGLLPREVAQRASGLLCTVRTPVDRPLLEELPSLRVVSNVAVGFDNVSIEAANAAGILVCNTPRVLDGAVADLAMGLVLCLARRLVFFDTFTRDGRWGRTPAPLGTDLSDKTMGILGMGRIGRMVAQRAQAFGMHIIYHNADGRPQQDGTTFGHYVARDELFKSSDFLSIHVPLTPETQKSVAQREFSMMKKTAFLVNTSRGPVVDEEALVVALQNGSFAGAGLDVFTNEPLDPRSALAKLENVVLLPHVGSGTVETRRAMIDLAVQNLVDAMLGIQPRSMVNATAWPINVKAMSSR